LELGRYNDPQHDGPEENDGKVEALVGRGREPAVGSGILSTKRDPFSQEESKILPTATKQQTFKPCGRFLILEGGISSGDSLILYDVSGTLALQRRELAGTVERRSIELRTTASSHVHSIQWDRKDHLLWFHECESVQWAPRTQDGERKNCHVQKSLEMHPICLFARN
jgi:hypothetical protein